MLMPVAIYFDFARKIHVLASAKSRTGTRRDLWEGVVRKFVRRTESVLISKNRE
jgi:hypothetical protein